VSERGFSATIEDILDDRDVDLAFLVFLDWPTSPVRVWTGVGSLAWDSQTWVGAPLLSIEPIALEGLEATDTGIQLQLDYLDDALRNAVNANDPVGAAASLYLAKLNRSPLAVVDAYELFPGFIDGVDTEDAGDSGNIEVRLASELALMDRSTYYTLSNAHQQHLFPGDLGMEFAARMDDPVIWGLSVLEKLRQRGLLLGQ